MDLIRKIPKKFTKKFGNKVINRQYFCRKTGLKCLGQKVNFVGKIKRWLEIILGAILGDSGYF